LFGFAGFLRGWSSKQACCRGGGFDSVGRRGIFWGPILAIFSCRARTAERRLIRFEYRGASEGCSAVDWHIHLFRFRHHAGAIVNLGMVRSPYATKMLIETLDQHLRMIRARPWGHRAHWKRPRSSNKRRRKVARGLVFAVKQGS
jgi:hypothetical protein